jgi:hypothetical protein
VWIIDSTWKFPHIFKIFEKKSRWTPPFIRPWMRFSLASHLVRRVLSTAPKVLTGGRV